MCKLFKVNKKRHQIDLTDIGTLRTLTLLNHTFSQHFTLEYGESAAGWVYQQRSTYRQVKLRNIHGQVQIIY